MLELLVGGALMLTGLSIGHITGRLASAGRTPAARAPTCSCGHARSQHDPETNRCHDQVERYTDAIGDHFVACPCRQYVGPEPVLSFWSPPLALPEDQP